MSTHTERIAEIAERLERLARAFPKRTDLRRDAEYLRSLKCQKLENRGPE